MRTNYYDSYVKVWVPILKKQYFKAKVKNDMNMILSLKENIYRNWHFDSRQKRKIWKMVGGSE